MMVRRRLSNRLEKNGQSQNLNLFLKKIKKHKCKRSANCYITQCLNKKNEYALNVFHCALIFGDLLYFFKALSSKIT